MSVLNAWNNMWKCNTKANVTATTNPNNVQNTATSSQSRTEVMDVKCINPDDVFIAITGVTGVGKSTFISKLVGDQVVIGHGMDSCIFLSDNNHTHT